MVLCDLCCVVDFNNFVGIVLESGLVYSDVVCCVCCGEDISKGLFEDVFVGYWLLVWVEFYNFLFIVLECMLLELQGYMCQVIGLNDGIDVFLIQYFSCLIEVKGKLLLVYMVCMVGSDVDFIDSLVIELWLCLLQCYCCVVVVVECDFIYVQVLVEQLCDQLFQCLCDMLQVIYFFCGIDGVIIKEVSVVVVLVIVVVKVLLLEWFES